MRDKEIYKDNEKEIDGERQREKGKEQEREGKKHIHTHTHKEREKERERENRKIDIYSNLQASFSPGTNHQLDSNPQPLVQ
jgi:hypothetical protein